MGRILAEKAARVGDRPWLLWEDKIFKYADLEEMTSRYANGFLSLGIRKGDHVALMLGNRPEFFFASWGLGKIGAVSVPINTAAKGELLRYFIDQSDSRWLIVDEECAGRVSAIAGHIPKVEGLLYIGSSTASDSELREARMPLADGAVYKVLITQSGFNTQPENDIAKKANAAAG